MMPISDDYYNQGRTSISIFAKQKKVFDRLQQSYGVHANAKLSTAAFFGVLMEYFQEHMGCREKNHVDRVLGKKKYDQIEEVVE